jgi:hypothetical protein
MALMASFWRQRDPRRSRILTSPSTIWPNFRLEKPADLSGPCSTGMRSPIFQAWMSSLSPTWQHSISTAHIFTGARLSISTPTGSLEGYHVQRLHAKTVGPLFADVPNVTDVLGVNIRQISGKLNYTPDCLDIPNENIHKSVTHAYNIFPNGVVVTSPYYISVMFLMPTAVNRTTVQYFMLTRSPDDNEKAKELYKKSYDMIVDVFGNEDFWAAQMSQAGLESGALDEVVYSGLEETIPRYYDILESCLPQQ